jgi:hypothetical protein
MIKEDFVLIAKGGYLKEPIKEEFSISDQDEEFMDGEDEFDSYEEYRKYVLEEAAAELEQKFATVIILTKEEFNQIKNK